MGDITNLTSTLVLYNTERILYCWREAIRSVLPISQRVVINACHDLDSEWKALGDFLADEISGPERDKIVMIRGKWGDKAECISELTNQCLESVNTPWFLNIQADEVLHENSYREITWLTTKQQSFMASRVQYNHFYNDFEHVGPFSYQRVVRIARKDLGWLSQIDGMELAGGQGTIWNGSILFNHYGKVSIGRSREAAQKEMDFQRMFLHFGPQFPDPLIVEAYNKGEINYNAIFADAIKRGYVDEFTGTHPKVLEEYISRMKAKEILDRAK